MNYHKKIEIQLLQNVLSRDSATKRGNERPYSIVSILSMQKSNLQSVLDNIISVGYKRK